MRLETSTNYTIIEGANKQMILERYLNNGSNRETALIDDLGTIASRSSERNRPDRYRDILSNIDDRLSPQYDHRSGFASLDAIVNKS